MTESPDEPEAAQKFRDWFVAAGGSFHTHIHYTPGTAHLPLVEFRHDANDRVSKLWLCHHDLSSAEAELHRRILPFLSRRYPSPISTYPGAVTGRR